MARTVLIAVAVALLVAAAHAQSADSAVPTEAECQQILQDTVGSEDALVDAVVNGCQSGGQFDENACCDTVKTVTSQAKGCECNDAVWSRVQGRIGSANIPGFDAGAVPGFLSTCQGKGLRVKGYGC